MTLHPLEVPSAQPKTGLLLVASPLLSESDFDRTVLLILEHDESGTFAVVLNRPSDVPIESVLPEWSNDSVARDILYMGGPVAPDSALGIGHLDRRTQVPDSVRSVTDELCVVDLDDEPHMSGLSAIRIFSGYAGWEQGQLDDELDEGAWYVLTGSPDDVFDPEPETLWRRVLRRQPSDLAFVATYPDDPALN